MFIFSFMKKIYFSFKLLIFSSSLSNVLKVQVWVSPCCEFSRKIFFFHPEKMFEMCVLLATNHLRVILSGLPFQWSLSFCDSCFMRGVLLLHFSGLGPEICFLYPFSQGHGSRSLLGLKNSLTVKFSFSTLSLWVYSMPCFIARSVICSKRFFLNVFLPF